MSTELTKTESDTVEIPGVGAVEIQKLMDRDRPTMTISDAVALLSAAAAIDNRKIAEVQGQEWAYALSGLVPSECLTAIRRIRQVTSEYLTPDKVRAEVMSLRRERSREKLIERTRREIAAFDALPKPDRPTEGRTGDGPEHPFWAWADEEARLSTWRYTIAQHDRERVERAERAARGLGPKPIERPAWAG